MGSVTIARFIRPDDEGMDKLEKEVTKARNAYNIASI
jgi:hypothetical protein